MRGHARLMSETTEHTLVLEAEVTGGVSEVLLSWC